jgi:hypothetical protein
VLVPFCASFPGLNFVVSPRAGIDKELSIDAFPALGGILREDPSFSVALPPVPLPSLVGRLGKMKSSQKSDNVPVLS